MAQLSAHTFLKNVLPVCIFSAQCLNMRGCYLYRQIEKKNPSLLTPFLPVVSALLCGLIPSRHAQHVLMATGAVAAYISNCARTQPYISASASAATGIMFDTTAVSQIVMSVLEETKKKSQSISFVNNM